MLDPNVLISALLSSSGAPAGILRRWREGAFELVVSEALVAELERAFAYPKLRRRIPASSATEFVAWLRRRAMVLEDPGQSPVVQSADPEDDYLIALAAENRLALVSGDGDLLDLAGVIPVFSAREFLTMLAD